MNNNSASQYMDKQIMDLSNSQSPAAGNSNSASNNDFIDFMNRKSEKEEDIVPSYDFMPIRPAVRSSSPPAGRASNFDSGDDDAPLRTWKSVESKSNTSPIRNYGSLDTDEPSKFILGKNYYKPTNAPLDATLVSEIDKTMKKYADDLMHAVDSLSDRLSQLETRTRNLENSIDDLKVSVGNNHGSTDGKMRLLENIIREVQSRVLVVKDKQEILEAQLQISKLHVSIGEQEAECKKVADTNSTKGDVAANGQISGISPTLSTPNAPPTPPLQTLPSQMHIPNQFPPNQFSSVPQQDSYFPPPSQAPENPSHQYQIPPLLQPQHHPTPSPPQNLSAPPPPQHQPAPSLPLQYQSHPHPQPQYSQSPTLSQPQPTFSALPHHPDDAQYISSQTYPPTMHPPTSVPPIGGPTLTHPPQQSYIPSHNVYEPPSRPGPGYSGSFGPSSGHGYSYPPYSGSPSQYGGGSPMKPQHHSSPGIGQSSGSSYPQLPTARILPQALPTASTVGSSSGSGSSGSGNRVPIDDVVDRVTNMGFPREQVRATVRRLTENGQAVDLNIVLDKLMNDGEGQGPRGGWFGR